MQQITTLNPKSAVGCQCDLEGQPGYNSYDLRAAVGADPRDETVPFGTAASVTPPERAIVPSAALS